LSHNVEIKLVLKLLWKQQRAVINKNLFWLNEIPNSNKALAAEKKLSSNDIFICHPENFSSSIAKLN
jgi:hypothetical protein